MNGPRFTECDCVEGEYAPRPSCPYCRGTGFEEIEDTPIDQDDLDDISGN